MSSLVFTVLKVFLKIRLSKIRHFLVQTQNRQKGPKKERKMLLYSPVDWLSFILKHKKFTF